MLTLQNKNEANKNTYMCPTLDIKNTTIPYNDNQPVESNAWDGKVYPIEFFNIDSKNISTLLLYMASFIRNRNLKCYIENNIL